MLDGDRPQGLGVTLHLCSLCLHSRSAEKQNYPHSRDEETGSGKQGLDQATQLRNGFTRGSVHSEDQTISPWRGVPHDSRLQGA